MITHYESSSRGSIEIATMPLSFAKNSLNKLTRTEPGRTAEIEALQAHVDKLATEAEAAALAGGEDVNPRAVVGGNNPPADEETAAVIEPKWDAVKVHLDDLLTEAQNWADGIAITTQGQADQVATLRQSLQEAMSLADEARKVEKAPLDAQVAEIQDRYNEYIAPLKNKKAGSATKAAYALGNLLTPWLQKLEDEKREREKKAREEAEAIAAAAREAHQEAAGSADLGAIDEAAELMDAADQAARTLRSVEREKVQAVGDNRAVGMRSYWKAIPVEGQGGKALVHYAQRQPERMKAFLQQLADEDVRAGIRTIPGFTVEEERRVA
ncbi:hypothetical protein EDF56_101181 [Novosphingobium sp. PhB165]|uniref:hypothetical protein n=1 Tax=Novosphingobium sp. PhB165 TaxID=2485105 RepID=UPI0010486186|nr:hypothetical protein [Novosphingobium sp. PhB165]TCM21517.1 hypothetical protein EDF56_101181 [Novosphingobium sp. PhB165]